MNIFRKINSAGKKFIAYLEESDFPQTVLEKLHIHTNMEVLAGIVGDGDENKYLGEDGQYHELPTVAPTTQVQSDFLTMDSSEPSYIKHKPAITFMKFASADMINVISSNVGSVSYSASQLPLGWSDAVDLKTFICMSQAFLVRGSEWLPASVGINTQNRLVVHFSEVTQANDKVWLKLFYNE